MTTFLNSSQEAVAFGKNANCHQIKTLKIFREFYLQAAKICKQSGVMEDLDKALFFATKAQFMREALEATNQS